MDRIKIYILELLHFRILIMIFLSAMSVAAFAQQDPVYTQYMNNMQSVNPANAGIDGNISIATIYRKQWVGLDGAPTTSSVTFAMPFDSMRISGGIDFMYDYTVPTSTMALFFDYAHQFRVTDKARVSLGLKAGFNFIEGKLTDLDRYHLDDGYILENGDFKRFMPNFGVGGYWYGDNYFVGFSIPRILQNKYNNELNNFTTKSREERHYFVHGAYRYIMSPDFVLQPTVTTIMVAGAPITADLDVALCYKEQITLGLLHRISDSFGAYIQFQARGMNLGIAYDMAHTQLRHYHGGTFEVMLRYDLKPRKKSAEGQTELYNDEIDIE